MYSNLSESGVWFITIHRLHFALPKYTVTIFTIVWEARTPNYISWKLMNCKCFNFSRSYNFWFSINWGSTEVRLVSTCYKYTDSEWQEQTQKTPVSVKSLIVWTIKDDQKLYLFFNFPLIIRSFILYVRVLFGLPNFFLLAILSFLVVQVVSSLFLFRGLYLFNCTRTDCSSFSHHLYFLVPQCAIPNPSSNFVYLQEFGFGF